MLYMKRDGMTWNFKALWNA